VIERVIGGSKYKRQSAATDPREQRKQIARSRKMRSRSSKRERPSARTQKPQRKSSRKASKTKRRKIVGAQKTYQGGESKARK